MSRIDLRTKASVIARSGLVEPIRPDRLARAAIAVRRWGATIAGGVAADAARFPHRVAVVDERRELTFETLHARSNALAHGLRAAGIGEGSIVGVMCRNHCEFVEAIAALAKLGATSLQLNTGFAAPQLREVIARERVIAVVFDEEFGDVVRTAAPYLARFVAWHAARVTEPSLGALVATGDRTDPTPPTRPGRTIILTSGTTGTPRGAPRVQTASIDPLVSLCSAIPLRTGETTVVAAPLFHSWGFGHLALGLLLGSTMVLHRRFDAATTLEAVAHHRASVLVAVPVMLQRMLDLPAATRRANDLSALRVVAASGSSLPGSMAPRFMDAFGDILYSLYGSTEVAYVSVATPDDLRVAPNAAGRPLPGVTVAVLDDRDLPVPTGHWGRIYAGNEMVFEGYTDGGGKRTARGLMSTGDVGRLDADGRLTVDGREDDMIVSGGENVFPEEVENLLADHPAVAEVAVVAVPDPDFGQRLKAVIVRRPDMTLTAADVRAYVQANLARFKAPRDVAFTDALPRNATGKVLHRDLVERQPLEPDLPGVGRAQGGPEGATQEGA